MHVAILIGAMLIGGGALASTTTDEDTTKTAPTAEQSDVTPSQSQKSKEDSEAAFSRSRSGGGAEMQQQMMHLQRQTVMPAAPTDSAAADEASANAPLVPPSAPTSNAPLVDNAQRAGAFGGGLNRPYGANSIMAPTRSRRYAGQTGTAFNTLTTVISQQSQRAQPMTSASSLTAPSQLEKAFSGYKPPAAVSPYMNLYRRDNLGTIDNYTTLVRPELEQRFLNQQMGRDVRSLQQTTNMQNASLKQLNRESQQLQGVATPQFYQNYGTYYQGIGQQQ